MIKLDEIYTYACRGYEKMSMYQWNNTLRKSIESEVNNLIATEISHKAQQSVRYNIWMFFND